jgi:hypothetical protein
MAKSRDSIPPVWLALVLISSVLVLLKNSNTVSKSDLHKDPNVQINDSNAPIAVASTHSDALAYQFGGTVNALVIDDCVAFIGLGPRVEETAICSANPFSVSSLSPVLNGVVVHLFMQGDHLYSITTTGTLYSFDRTQGSLYISGFLDLGFLPINVFVHDKSVYVVGWTEGVYVVDLSDASLPRIMSRYNSPMAVDQPVYKDIIGTDKTIYVLITDGSTNEHFVYKLSIPRPTDITEQSRLLVSFSDDVAQLALRDNLLYVVQPGGQIVTVDVSSMSVTTQWNLNEGNPSRGSISDFKLSGNYALVAWTGSRGRLGDGQIQVLSVEEASTPKVVDEFVRGGWIPSKLSLSGKTLLASDNRHTIYLLALSDTYKLSQTDMFVIPFAGVTSIAALDGETLGASTENGLWASKIRDIPIPTDRSYVPGATNSVVKYDQAIIGLSDTSMFIYSLEPNLEPRYVEIKSTELGLPDRTRMYSVCIFENTAIIASYWPSQRDVGTTIVTMVDLSDIQNPTVIGRTDYDGDAGDRSIAIAVVEKMVIIAHGQQDARLIDVSDKTKPTLVDSGTPVGQLSDVYSYQSYVVGVTGNKARLFELLEGTTLRELATVTLPGRGSAVVMDRGRFYVAYERSLEDTASPAGKMIVFDATDKNNPKRKSEIEFPGRISDMSAAGNYLYLSSNNAGVAAVSIEGHEPPVNIFLPLAMITASATWPP